MVRLYHLCIDISARGILSYICFMCFTIVVQGLPNFTPAHHVKIASQMAPLFIISSYQASNLFLLFFGQTEIIANYFES